MATATIPKDTVVSICPESKNMGAWKRHVMRTTITGEVISDHSGSVVLKY